MIVKINNIIQSKPDCIASKAVSVINLIVLHALKAAPVT